MSWARRAPSHRGERQKKKFHDESLFPPGSMEEEQEDLSIADLSTDSSEWSESDGEAEYDPFLGPRADCTGLPLVLDDSKRKFSSPTAACGSTSPSMRIRKDREQGQDPASCPAQLCNVRSAEGGSGHGAPPLTQCADSEEVETVALRPGARKRRRAKVKTGLEDVRREAPVVPSLDEIVSVDITNDDAYNRILSNIAKQRSESGSSRRLSRKMSKSPLPPHASNWATATRTGGDSPRRRVQASSLGAARMASASARLCAIENAVLGLEGVGHMHEFLEKKRESFLKESAKWQAQLNATQQKKHDLLEELKQRCDENSALHRELQEQGLDRALSLLEKLLANVKRVSSSVRDRVEAPGSDISLHYSRNAEGPQTFRMDAGADISGSVGRAAAAFARAEPVRRMGRTASVSLFSSQEVLTKKRTILDAPALSMASSEMVKKVKSPQALDDAIVCILSTVEALRSTYCISDFFENGSKIEWFPFGDMEQTNDELESALKSIASENKTLKESLDLSKAASSNLERMCEDAESIASSYSKLTIDPSEASMGVLRSSRSLKVTSSLLSMQADLAASFPSTNSQNTSQVEWSTDKGEAHIKNASLDSLLSIVTSSSDATNSYLKGIKRTFFLTFRYFLTIPELLEKLVLRFCMCPPQTIPSQPSQANYSGMERDRRRIQQPDRAGIMEVIHHWVEEWFDLDFRHDKDNLDKLRAFLRNTAAKCGSFKAAERTELLISRLLLQSSCLRESAKSESTPTEDDGADLGSLGAEMGALEAMKITSFMDISPKDLAEQLTLLESKQYRRIQPCELLRQSWNKKDKELKAPNLQQTFQHFNSISALFVCAILAEAEVEARASVIRHVLVTGMHFLRLNNYNGVIEVVSALQSSAVERLWLTWNYLGKHIYAAKQLLCTITANNMQAFRYLWKEGGYPSIPYVGVFLTDLTFLEDGNPTWADGSCTLVNMFKFRMIEHTISVLLSSKAEEDYSIEEDPAVQAFFVDLIKTAPAVNEDAWYRMSLSLESRDAAKQAGQYSIKYDFETLQEAVSALVSLRTHPLLDGEDITLADDEVELAGHAHISTRETSEPRMRSNAVLEVKFTPLELDNIASRMRASGGGVLRKDRRFRMKVYHDAFLGNDAVDWLVSHEAKLTSRTAAVKLGKMLTKMHYIRHVTNDHSFKDKPHIYQFVENVSRPRGRPRP